MNAHQPTLKKIGPLEVLDLGSPVAEWTVVFFHGFGADAYDLSAIADEIDLPVPLRWLFPQGPMSVPIAPGFSGRAWFSIDVEAIDRAMRGGEQIDYSAQSTAKMQDVRDKTIKMFTAAGIKSERLILGGFSQGAMLAVEVALNLSKPPAAVVILSGTLVDLEGLKKLSAKRQGLKFFQSHGEKDTVLPYGGAERLERALCDNGWDGYLLNFSGGHEIPRPVIRELNSYLRALVSNTGH